MRTLLLLSLLAGPIAHTAPAQVQNPGFEAGLSGWNMYCPCQAVQFTGDVPPGGGAQSLGVGILDFNCFCSIVETIHQPVPWMYPGQWVLSAWIKNADPGNAPGAAVRLSEGPAYSSPILADAWSDDGVWTFVADTFLITSSTDIASLQLSLIPDDGNQMPAGLFAAFDQVQLQPLISTGVPASRAQQLQVFPSPAGELLTVDLPPGCRSLRIMDTAGRPWLEQPVDAGAMSRTLTVSGLLPGQYILEATMPSGQAIRSRFLKL